MTPRRSLSGIAIAALVVAVVQLASVGALSAWSAPVSTEAVTATKAGPEPMRWEPDAPPPVLLESGLLESVSCPAPGFCMAVGAYFDDFGWSQPLAEVWDGVSWELISAPRTTDSSELEDVSCLSATACVAVGNRQDGRGDRPVAYSWDGHQWLATVPPDQGKGNYLYEVSCSAPDSCVAVGATGWVASIQRWDGRAWTPVAVPRAFRTATDISCPSDGSCMAIGRRQDGDSVAIRWNGLAWSLVEMPPGQVNLSALSCTSADFCVAAGDHDSDLTIELWNGTSWTEQDAPAPSSSSSLRDVSCASASSCYAIGYAGNAYGHDEIVVTLDGEEWVVSSTPDAQDAEPRAISCASPTACKAVGSRSSYPRSAAFAQSWDGTSWTVDVVRSHPATYSGEGTDVSCVGEDFCAAVGFYGDYLAAIQIRSSGAWRLMRPPGVFNADGTAAKDRPLLTDVSCVSDRACVAVGFTDRRSPVALAWDGDDWRTIEGGLPPRATSLYGVSCTAKDDCIAVGSRASRETVKSLLAVWNGATWRTVLGPSSSSLSDVSCTDRTFCAAVGTLMKEKGAMTLIWNGRHLAPVASPGSKIPGSRLYGVSCSSRRWCAMVGWRPTGAFLQTWNGRTWRAQSGVRGGDDGSGFFGVSCAVARTCVAVGVYGHARDSDTLVEVANGSRWRRVVLPHQAGFQSLSGVSCTSAKHCLAVGNDRSQPQFLRSH